MDHFQIIDEDRGCIGRIKVNRRQKQFNAHCCQLGPPYPKDHRTEKTPECRINRQSSHVPQLAFLVQWLRQSPAFANRGDHLASTIIIDAEDRRECREWLCRQPLLEPLLRFEAEFLGLEWHGVETVRENDVLCGKEES